MPVLLAILLVTIHLQAQAAADPPTRWVSPDGKLEAFTVNRGELGSPHLNWDVVTIRTAGTGNVTIASLSLEEGSGINRAGVVEALWSPDSRFYLFQTNSSGGHSIWHSPTYVFDRETAIIYSIDDTIGSVTGGDDKLTFSASDEIKVELYNGAGGGEDPFSFMRKLDLKQFVKTARVALHSVRYPLAAKNARK